MSTILVIAEQEEGRIRPVTAELVSAALDLPGSSPGTVTVAVVARDPDPLIAQLAYEGVDQIAAVTCDSEPTGEHWREACAVLIAEHEPDVVLAGFTVRAMDFAPAVAAARGWAFESDVLAGAIDDGIVKGRHELYGGKLMAEFEVSLPAVLLARPTAWAAAAAGGAPPVTRHELALPGARVRHLEFERASDDDVGLADAPVILAIGRGIGEQENVAIYADLAERLGIALAGSRPLVDMGWIPPARLVGQSGQTVAPKLYLAFGISGATQHLAGMRGAARIVAVNTDPMAPIFGVADYGAVADIGDVADELSGLG